MSKTLIVRGDESISAVTEFESSCDRVGLFQTSGWLRLWGFSGFEAGALLLIDGNETASCFPFCLRRRFGQTECYSMPNGTYGGAISFDATKYPASEVENAFVRFADQSGFSRVNVVEFSAGTNPTFLSFHSSSLVTHVLSLCDSVERIFENFSDSHRRNVSKSERNNLLVRGVNSEQDIDDYWRLSCSSAQRRGRKSRYTREFLTRLRMSLPGDHSRWQLAVQDGRPCAGQIYICRGKDAFYWDGCSDEMGRGIAANHFLFWRNIAGFAGDGYKSLNLGASPKGADALARFKAGWGAKETTYFEYDRRSALNKALSVVGKMVRG